MQKKTWNRGKSIFRKAASAFRLSRHAYNKFVTIHKLLAGIGAQPQLNTSPTIVFNTVRSRSVFIDIELFLAYQLARRGAKVKVFIDDGIMEHWDLEQLQHVTQGRIYDPYRRLYNKKKTAGYRIQKFRDKLFNKIEKKGFEFVYAHKNLEVVNYSDFINRDTENVEISEYERNQAYSSTIRFFENGLIDLSKKEHNAYFQKSLKNSLLSKKIGQKILKQLNPDLFITSHGIYSTWGPCCKVMRQEDIKTVIWELHFSKREKMILVDDIIQLLSNDSDWQHKKEEELDDSSIELVQNEFKSRLNHQTLDTETLFNGTKGGGYNNEILNNWNSDGTVFGLFPNVSWDGNIHERNKLFNDLTEWIEYTIEEIKNTNNKLIIRFHPSEATLQKGSKQLERHLIERNSELKSYDNIKLISSDSQIDTYVLARRYIDVGLIYSGTLALELTYMDIPVISCGRSFYFGVGFCFEPRTKDEYLNMLRNAKGVQTSFAEKKEQFKTNLNRFAHWYFFDAAYELPIMDKNGIYEFCYDTLEPQDVDPQKNLKLSRTIDKLLQGFT